MDAKFDKYWNFDSLNPILVVAIGLDPRYKLQFVEFWYFSYLEKCPNLSDVEKAYKMEVLVEKLKDLMCRLYSYYKAGESPYFEHDFSTPRDQVNDSNVVEKMIKKNSKDFFRGILKRKECSEVSNDLDKYLADSVVEIDDRHFDVVAWWKGKLPT